MGRVERSIARKPALTEKEKTMNLENMTVKEFMELKNLFSGVRKQKAIEDGGIRIVILQRGWVFVGRYSQKGSECKLDNACVIRQWGTSKGLGEIAMNGPTDKTVLDKTPTVEFHELTVIATIKCEDSKWLSKLS